MQANKGRALAGGIAGTAAITWMMYYVAPLMTGQPMDLAGMLAGMLDTAWSFGLTIHLILGIIVFPLFYAYIICPRVTLKPWLKGMLFGAALWLAAELVVMPLAGGGVFHSQAGGTMAVIGALFGHLVYGTLLGGVTGSGQAERKTHSQLGDFGEYRRSV